MVVWRLTLIPASRAASGLPPTARVRRPKVVRLSSNQPPTATRAKMTTISGTPRTSAVQKSLNPSTFTICVRRSEMISASPRAAASIARVMMKGTMLPYAISTPLTSPQAPPTARATNTMTIQWVSSAIVWVAKVVAHTEESATMAPTDRSMPPPMITNVMPMLTTPTMEASRRIVTRVSTLAKRSPAVETPTTQITSRASTRPRLRPNGSAHQAGASRRPLGLRGGVLHPDGVARRSHGVLDGGQVGSLVRASGVVRWSLMRRFLP